MIEAAETDIILKGADESDFQPIWTLCNLRYGAGYMDRRDFELWMEQPELLRVAMYKGEFAGFSVMVPKTAEMIAREMKIDRDEILEFSSKKPVLLYKSAALVPKYEHLGIMLTMLQNELETGKRMGCGAVYGSAWKYDGTVPMAKLFNITGFEIYAERKMLWYHLKDYSCVICGGRCKCDAVIYRKKL